MTLLPSWLLAFSRGVVAPAGTGSKSRLSRLSFDVLEDRAVPSAALVRDINTNTVGSSPANLVDVNGRVVFSAGDSAGNVALYASRGTAADTVVVREFPSNGLDTPYLTNLTDVNGTVFFSVGRAQFGGPSELWATDGTTSGTRLVRDFGADVFAYQNGSPILLNDNGTAYFLIVHRTPTETVQLWMSNGTTTNQIDPGAFSVNSFSPGLTVVGDTLYFAASDPVNGAKLWRTDGTDGGTQIADGDVAALGARGLTAVGDDVYFFATLDPTNQTTDLYKFDGAATTLVQVAFSNFSNLQGANVDGRLFFSAATTAAPFADQLWVSDGTGTTMLNPAHAYAGGLRPFYLTSFNGRLLFNGFDDAGHFEPIWVSDGTDAGTQVLFPNTEAFATLVPGSIARGSDALYFGAQGFHSNQELWKTDGTAGGTVRIADFGATSVSSFAPSGLTISDGTLFLDATDKAHGAELWTSDGTTLGTKLVTDINKNTMSGFDNFGFPTYLVNINKKLMFNADDGQGPPTILNPQIWKSNGKASGTNLVATPFPGGPNDLLDGPVNLTSVGHQVFFTPLNDPQLWVTDGTATGTKMLRDFSVPNAFIGQLANLTAVGDELYFTVSDPASPIGAQQMWKSDGTLAGTVKVADNLFLSYGSGIAFDGRFFFAAFDLNTFATQLWMSNGTAAGTHVVDSGHPGSRVRNLTVVDDTIYYFDADDTNGFAVWKTNGTKNKLVADIHSGNDYWFEYNPIAVNGKLSFAALNGSTGAGELWKSNGSAKGTFEVAGVHPDFASVAAVGKQLFFTVTDPTTAVQYLWVSDGSAAGTKAVAPVVGGTDVFGDPLPFDLTAFKGLLYFAASDPDHGRELWQSDGTADGTFMSQDINPSRADSSPEQLTEVGDRLFFTAEDLVHGRELWVLKQGGHSDEEHRKHHVKFASTNVSEPRGGDATMLLPVSHAPVVAYNTGAVRSSNRPVLIQQLLAPTTSVLTIGHKASNLQAGHAVDLSDLDLFAPAI